MDIDSDDEDWDLKSTQRLKKTKMFTGGARHKNEKLSMNDRSTQKTSKVKFLVDSSKNRAYNDQNKRLKGPHTSEPKCKRNAKGTGVLATERLSSKTADFECIVIEESRTDDSLSSMQYVKVDKTKRDEKTVGKIKETNRNAVGLNNTNRKEIDKFKSKEKRSPRKPGSKTKLLKTPSRKIHEGYCPFCQMPFAALIIQSPNWHTMECMDLPITSTTECPDGLKCDSTLHSHYRRFLHTLLAQSRAGTSPAKMDNQVKFETLASQHTVETSECESIASYIPDQFKHCQSSIGCNTGKKCSDLTLDSSCSPGSKLKSSNNTNRRSLHKKEHSHSKSNIAKFFSSSQENKTNMYFDCAETTFNEKSSEQKCKQKYLVQEGNKYVALDGPTEYICELEHNLMLDAASEIQNEMSCSRFINSDKIMVGVNINKLDLDEECGDPMHLLKESDSDVDSVGSDSAPRGNVMTICVEGLDQNARVNSNISSVQCNSVPSAVMLKSSLAKSLDAQFSEDDEDQTESQNTKAVERSETPVTETVSSVEDNISIGCFDENIDYSDIETPEILEDGSVKVRNRFADTFFPTSSEVFSDNFQKQETLLKPVCNNNLTNQSVGAIIDNPVIPFLMNATKQTSLFGFFQKVNCKNTSGTSFEKQKSESRTDTVKLHKPVSSNINRSDSFGIKDPLPVQRRSGPQAISGGNCQQTISRNDVSSEQKMNYCDLAIDVSTVVENPQEGYRGRKYNCPFYKKIPDTSITVDAFRYGNIPGCKAYVLTHFHYDHYGGLTKRFSQPLYCSKVTGNLVKSKIKVSEQFINILPMNKPCIVEDVELTLMEANHCPGAVIILFRLKDGRSFLHTGDFRASSEMEEYSPLIGVTIDLLYLDTTYCDTAYVFPSQKDVIQFAVGLVQTTLQQNPRTLIVCGTYTIGKEKIFLAIAEAINSKIGVARDKKVILDCLEDDRLTNRITLDLSGSQVHVLPMAKLRAQTLSEHLFRHNNFSQVLALEPTGWTYSNKFTSLDQIRPKYSKTGITIYGIPYSEHSSYSEMKRFTQFIQPRKILPTVNNGNPQSRKKMEAHFECWMNELDNPVSTNTAKQASIDHWL